MKNVFANNPIAQFVAVAAVVVLIIVAANKIPTSNTQTETNAENASQKEMVEAEGDEVTETENPNKEAGESMEKKEVPQGSSQPGVPTDTSGQETGSSQPVVTEVTRTTIAVPLVERAGSRVTGSALLTAVGKRTEVTISVSKPAAAEIQPAYIHSGLCLSIGEAKHVLNNLRDGISSTILEVSPGTIVDDLPLAIAIHKSPQEFGSIVACGNISL